MVPDEPAWIMVAWRFSAFPDNRERTHVGDVSVQRLDLFHCLLISNFNIQFQRCILAYSLTRPKQSVIRIADPQTSPRRALVRVRFQAQGGGI